MEKGKIDKLQNDIIELKNCVYQLEFKIKYLEKYSKLKWWEKSKRRVVERVESFDAPKKIKLIKMPNYDTD